MEVKITSREVGLRSGRNGTGKERKFPEDGKGDKGERKTAPRVRQKEDRRRPGLCRSAKGSSQEERGRRRTRTRSEIGEGNSGKVSGA